MINWLFKKFRRTSSGCVRPNNPGPSCPPEKTVTLTPVSSYTIEKIGWLIENGDWKYIGPFWREQSTGLVFMYNLFLYNGRYSFLTQFENLKLTNIWKKKEADLIQNQQKQKDDENKILLNDLISRIEKKINEHSKSL